MSTIPGWGIQEESIANPSVPKQIKKKEKSWPLGRMLLENGLLSADQLRRALAIQRRTYQPLGRILSNEFDLRDSDLVSCLLDQSTPRRVFLRFFPVDQEALRLLDIEFCYRFEVAGFQRLGDLLCVACKDPKNRPLLDRIQRKTGLYIQPFSAPWEDIQRLLTHWA